eukprot:71167_1
MTKPQVSWAWQLVHPYFLHGCSFACISNEGMMFIVAAMKGNQWNEHDFFNFQPMFPERYDEVASEIVDYVDQKYPAFSSMGILSLLLTVANVIMVAAGSALMFRAKEVLPVKKKVFW